MKTYDALIRVSRMGDRKQSAESTMTLDDQASVIGRAIKEAGGRRGKTFEAIDQSGFTIHKNGVYEQILDRVRQSKSSGLVVAYGDRLTRNWRAVGAFYDALEAAGGEVIIAGMPGVDYRTPLGRMVTGMMAVAGEVVSTSAQTRSRSIADGIMARGVPCRVPYGYRRNADEHGVKTDPERDGKALVPDDVLSKRGKVIGGTAQTVRRIFQMRADGFAWALIVKTLNEGGTLAPSGGYWLQSSLANIIRNETYTGVVKLGKRRSEGAHEPLVSAALWRRVQSVTPVIRNGNLVAGIAGGLLVCSGCDKTLSTIGSNHGKPSYGCRRTSSAGPCSRPVCVSKASADEYVHDAVRDVLTRGGVDAVSSARDVQRAKRAVDEARAECKAFVKLASALDEDDFREGYAERKEREVEAARVFDDLLAHAADADEMPTNPAGYDALDLKHQRRVAQSLIARIVVSPPLTPSVRDRVIEDRFTLDWKRAG